MNGEDSLRIDEEGVAAFAADPDNPYLVSFPRTGSHWLRMVVELTFGRPTLVRNFYHHERRDYLLLHTHDLDLDLERRRVLYLWRDPVDTVFSQLQYEDEPIEVGGARRWAEQYGRHLDKWLCRERFTASKLVLTYEALRRDAAASMTQVATFLEVPFAAGPLAAALERVTHDEVKRKTRHDPRVVASRDDYAGARAAFHDRFGALVRATVLAGRPGLARIVEGAVEGGAG